MAEIPYSDIEIIPFDMGYFREPQLRKEVLRELRNNYPFIGGDMDGNYVATVLALGCAKEISNGFIFPEIDESTLLILGGKRKFYALDVNYDVRPENYSEYSCDLRKFVSSMTATKKTGIVKILPQGISKNRFLNHLSSRESGYHVFSQVPQLKDIKTKSSEEFKELKDCGRIQRTSTSVWDAVYGFN